MNYRNLDPIDAAAAYAHEVDAEQYREELAEQIGDALMHALRCWPTTGEIDEIVETLIYAVADEQIERDAREAA